MRIRRLAITPSTLLLLAVGFFGVPRASNALEADPQLRVSYYEQWTESHAFRLCYYPNPYLPTLKEEYSYWNLWYDPWDNGTFLTTETWNDCPPPMQHRDESWSQTSWPCCADQNDIGWKTWWHWSGGAYDEGYDPVDPIGPPWPWKKCSLTNIAHRTSGDFEWDDIITDRYETRLELLTGGETNSTKEALFLMWVSATTGSGQGIPPGQLSALGKTAIPDGPTYGNIYKKLSDNQKVDATVTAPGDCYTFTADVGKAYLILRRNGEDITEKTNVVWVGERIDLECVLSPSFGDVTNYQWTVPGDKVSGYHITLTNGFAIPFTNSHLTNPVVIFYWISGQQSASVECTVQVEGETLTARTKFEVRKPEADFWLTPKSQLMVTTNNCIGNSTRVWYLTPGLGCSTNDVGMLYSYRLTDLKGYTKAYSVSMVQLVTVDWKWNSMVDPPHHYWALERGIDGSYPYVNWGQKMYGHIDDTPRTPLNPPMEYLWERTDFDDFLMWQPQNPSIPVPLKAAHWDYYGRAQLVDTNPVPARYVGVHPFTHPQPHNGINWSILPGWTNLIVPTNVNWHVEWYKLSP